MRLMLIIAVACCMLFASTDSATADSWSQKYIDNADLHERLMFEAKAKLQDQEPAMWDDAMLADYHVNMGAAIYNALVAYCGDNDSLPADLTEVVGPYLSEWPLNPQNGWMPVRVLSLGDDFAAGDLVYQECDFSYYSITGRIKDNMLTAQSFELSVYGPSIDHHQETSINIANEDWGVVPVGAILSLGMYTESAYDVLARFRAREEKQAVNGDKETADIETADGSETHQSTSPTD